MFNLYEKRSESVSWAVDYTNMYLYDCKDEKKLYNVEMHFEKIVDCLN